MITDKDIAAKQAALARRIQNDVMTGYINDAEGLSGFGLKSITKGISHAARVVKAAPRKVARITRLVATHPRQGLKEVAKLHVNVARETFKAAKKGAPLALGAAALYFGGGPLAIAKLAQSAGATVGKVAALAASAQSVAGAAPPPAPEMAEQPPEVLVQDPNVQALANELLRMQTQQQYGVTMDSQEANDLLAAQTQQTAESMAVQTAEPKKSNWLPALAIAVPVISLLS